MQKIEKITGILAICLLGIFHPLCAQDLTSDLKKIRDARSQDWCKMSVQYVSYETYDAREPEDKTEAISIENGSGGSFFDNELSTSVSIDGKTLLLDKEDKKIYLLDRGGTLDRFGKMEPDSLLKLCSDVRFLGSEAGVHSYELVFSSSLFEYNKIRLQLDMKQMYVSELTIYYQRKMPKLKGTEVVAWLKPRLKIRYTLQEVTARDQERLNMAHYMVKKGGIWSPKPAFKNYEIIDQTSKP
ncbi:MAG: hypothetical protein ACPF9D_02320 [Owenweeksia sp.]